MVGCMDGVMRERAMRVISAGLLVVALVLAALLGPKLNPWLWGGALVATGLAVVVALPGLWRRGGRGSGWWLGGLGVMTAAWFGMRAWTSPVADYAVMDGMLLAAAVGGFMVARSLEDDGVAERVFIWGLAALLFASVVVVIRQVYDPAYTPGLVSRFPQPSGFFGHYNYGANFLIGSSCLVGGVALFGKRFLRIERFVWGVVAALGIGVIYFTGSRGGQLGAAFAMAVFAVMAMIGAKRSGAGWFAPAVIALPFVGILVVAFLVEGWSKSQELRESDARLDVMMDNTIRLHLIGIAVSCVAEHPWVGGGSRSFSWECNRHWDNDVHGYGGNRPEQVHNELLQSASDYGLVGAGLLVVWLVSMVIAAIVRAALGDRVRGGAGGDAWRVGGLAAVCGMLVQANFSFVYHLVPGALLLGICLGRMMHSEGAGRPRREWPLVANGVACVAGVLAAIMLIPWGWRGARVTAARWVDGFGMRPEASAVVRMAAIGEAIRIWPLGEFFLERARLLQFTRLDVAGGVMDAGVVAEVVADYREAAQRNPHDPIPVVNMANLLSVSGDEAGAEEAFAEGIRLQGGMETGYRGYYHLAAHHQRKAVKRFMDGDLAGALAAYEGATAAIEEAAANSPAYVIGDELRVAVHEGRGMVCEAMGDWKRALAAYDEAAALRPGGSAHYRAAVLLGRRALAVWMERRPAEAMAGFIEARRRFMMAAVFPPEVTLEQRKAVWDYLNERIRAFEAARIQPDGP